MNVCFDKENNIIFKEELKRQQLFETITATVNPYTRNDGGKTEDPIEVEIDNSTRYGKEYVIPLVTIQLFNTDTDKPYLYLDFINKEDGNLFKRFEFHATTFNWLNSKAKSGTVLKDLYELYSELVQIVKDNKNSNEGYLNILEYIKNTYSNYDMKCN